MSESPGTPASPLSLTESARRWLLDLARATLARELGTTAPTPGPRPDDPALDVPTRLFVSWHLGPRLVGCMGSLAPAWTLAEGVPAFALKAGLQDRRTPNPSAEDVPRLSCEVSVLGEQRPLLDARGEPVEGLSNIAAALTPRHHGVELRHLDGRRAYFLPVVWDQLPDPSDFVVALCRKAGIDPVSEGGSVRGEVNEVLAFAHHGA